MVILHELAVGFLALLLAEDEALAGAVCYARLLFEVVVERVVAVRPGAVGPVGRFDLQDAEIDTHLNDLPAVAGLHHACLHHAGLVVPTLQRGVDVLLHWGLLVHYSTRVPSVHSTR